MKKNHRITHGLSHTRAYRIWQAMKHRCKKDSSIHKKNPNYIGIEYNKNWDIFLNFLSDMGEPGFGMSLDRIDNSKGYSKSNCRWATYREQANNTSRNRILKYKGVNYTASNLARHLGISVSTLFTRIRLYGIDSEKLFFQGKMKKCKKQK